MKTINNLIFKDNQEKSFVDAEIKRFVENFIDQNIYQKIEISKDEIYLYRHNESGLEHFTFYGLKPTTAREMIIYITALNNSSFTKTLFKKS